MLQIEVVKFEQLEKIRNVWLALQSKGGVLCFQSFEWINSWCATIGRSQAESIRIVLVSEGDRPILILPFVASGSSAGGKRLSFLGDPLSDLNAPVFCPDTFATVDVAGMASLWSKVIREVRSSLSFDFVFISQIPAKVGSFPNPLFLLARADWNRFSHRRKLEANRSDFQSAALTTKMAADSRRCLKKLGEIGEVRIISMQLTNSIAETEACDAIDWLLDQKHKQLIGMNEPSIFGQSAVRDFYKKLWSTGGGIEISLLTVGGQMVAGHFGSCIAGVFYYLVPAYQGGEWRKYSVGRLLLESLFERRIEENAKYFDFTIGAEAYKDLWCNESVALGSVVAATSVRGTVPATFRKLKAWARRSGWVRKSSQLLRRKET